MPKFIAKKRLESRDENGVKQVIEAGTLLDMTAKQAAGYGDSLSPAKSSYVAADKSAKKAKGDDGGEGGDGADGGEGGNGSDD